VRVTDLFDALELNDNFPLDEEIEAKALFKFQPCIGDRNRDLSFDLQARASKLVRQDDLVYRLQ
jgi:hypothetical protein